MSGDIERSERERLAARSTEITAFLFIAAVIIIACVYSPPDEPTVVLCLFRRLTGLPCPGCGMTRSFCALAKGHLHESLSFHPLGPLIFFSFILVWLRAALLLTSEMAGLPSRWTQSVRTIVNDADTMIRRPRLIQTGVALVLSVWVIRLMMRL